MQEKQGHRRNLQVAGAGGVCRLDLPLSRSRGWIGRKMLAALKRHSKTAQIWLKIRKALKNMA